MKTLIFTEIDGLKIVRGIGEPSIDGVATEQKIKPLIFDTPESKAVEGKKKEIWQRSEKMSEAKKDYRKAYAITQSDTAPELKKEKAVADMEKSKVDQEK